MRSSGPQRGLLSIARNTTRPSGPQRRLLSISGVNLTHKATLLMASAWRLAVVPFLAAFHIMAMEGRMAKTKKDTTHAEANPANNVRKLREARKWTQWQIAKISRLSERTIQRVESG